MYVNITSLSYYLHIPGVGTTAYASPEQLTSSNISSSSDMYSLGVVLFELLTPFNTDMERVKALADLRKSVKSLWFFFILAIL